MQKYDVVIVGGGPAGLAAALMLGRGRKRVLLFDAGPPRNAAAVRVHGFVTQDGTPPAELRRIAREQLRPYPSVEVVDARVDRIEPRAGSITVGSERGVVEARRVLLATGMVDVLPEVPGYRALWGKSIFQCPYCHGWEAQDRAFGYWAPSVESLEFALFLKGWTSDVVVFTSGAFVVPDALREALAKGGVPLEERPIAALVERDGELAAVQLEGGVEVARDVLFVRPPQRQSALVESLGLALDAQGFVKLDEQGETSIPRIHAAGDLTTMLQAALMAAAAGATAAARINHALTMER